jgi:hypothetical protein
LLYFRPEVTDKDRLPPAARPGVTALVWLKQGRAGMKWEGEDRQSLTIKRIAKLKKKPGRYGDGQSLYLQVLSPTNCSWLLRYERDRHERMMGLGPLHTFGLSEARERARKVRQLIYDGINPLDQKKAEKAARALEAAKSKTFKECADDFFVANRDSWRSVKWAKQFGFELGRYAYPVVGNLSIADIDTGLVLRVLEQQVPAARGLPAGTFWLTRNRLASRVRGRIEQILDWSTVRGYRTGDNPARWTHLKHALGKKAANGDNHHAALPYADSPRRCIDAKRCVMLITVIVERSIRIEIHRRLRARRDRHRLDLDIAVRALAGGQGRCCENQEERGSRSRDHNSPKTSAFSAYSTRFPQKPACGGATQAVVIPLEMGPVAACWSPRCCR